METDHMIDWLTIYSYLLANTSSQHIYILYTSQETFTVLDLIFVNSLAT